MEIPAPQFQPQPPSVTLCWRVSSSGRAHGAKERREGPPWGTRAGERLRSDTLMDGEL